MISFLTGNGALIVMTALCVVQAAAYLMIGKYPQAAMLTGFAIADAAIIWGAN